MKKYEERVIDGDTWLVVAFSATEGIKIGKKLLSIAGVPIGKALGGLAGSGSLLDKKIDFGAIGAAIGDLFERLGDDELDELLKRLLKCTQINGKDVAPQFDVVFQRRYATLIKVALFAIEVNFDIPLDSWLTLASEAIRKESQSMPETSSDPSEALSRKNG
jgi:hypothetical protein